MQPPGGTNQGSLLRQPSKACWYNYPVVILWVDGGVFVGDAGVLRKSQSVVTVVLCDVHFWIPAAVLLGGLAVLRWIS